MTYFSFLVYVFFALFSFAQMDFESQQPLPTPKMGLHYIIGDTYVLNGRVDCIAKVGLEDAPNITRVELNSYGGDIEQAFEMAEIIKQRGLATSVSGICMSACTILFQAGRLTYVEDDAVFMFHKAFASRDEIKASCNLCSDEEIDRIFHEAESKVNELNTKLYSFFESNGLTKDFVSRLKNSKSDILIYGKDLNEISPQASSVKAGNSLISATTDGKYPFVIPDYIQRCDPNYRK